MGRHRIRSFLSSIFKDHLDSDNHGWLEEHRREIEDKVKKILELVDEGKEGNPNEEEELTGLIHDFYKYYQVLHERYDQLAGDLKKNVNGRERNDASSSSSSSSDSETEKSGRNDKRRKHHKSGDVNKDLQDQHENLKQELRASQDAENDMKQKFTSITEEKNSLSLQNANAVDRLNVADKKIEKLLVLSEQWNKDKLLLDAEISDLNLQLETERKLVANLESSLEATDKEKTDLSLLSEQWNKDKLLSDAEISDLKLQLETERKLVANLKSSLEAADKLKNELSLLSEQGNKDKLLSDAEISDLKLQLEAERKLVANLKSSLEATDKEKNDLSLEIISALRKAEDMKKTVDNLEGEVKVLKGENVTLLSNIESHKQENTVTMDSLQQAHKTIKDYSSEMEKLAYENSALRAEKEAAGKEISNLNEILTATYRERDVLVSDQLSMTGKLEDAERIIEELKKEIQLLKLGLSERDSINDNLQKELEVACQKIDTQSQLLFLAEESKNKLILENSEAATKLEHAEVNLREAHEKVQLLMEENVMSQQRHDDLEGKVRELENRLMKKEEEISDLQRKYEVEKKEAFGQIDDLKIQINEHQLQHSSLSTVKRELEEQIEIGKNEAHEKHKQTESLKEELTGKIRNLEQKYEDREQEVSNLIAVLEEARSKASEQIDDLQSKYSLLSSQKQEAEGKMETVEMELTGKILELEKLLEEKEEKVRELENRLMKKEEEISDLQRKYEVEKKEAFGQIDDLKIQINEHQLQHSSLSTVKRELEEQIEIGKNEAHEKHKQTESLKEELTGKMRKLEQKYEDREQEVSNLIAVLEEARSKASEQIDDLQSKHSLLSSQKQEAEGKMETVEMELTGKILELEKLLEEKEEMCRISDENHKQLEAKFQKSCDELQEAESKRSEVEEILRMLRLEVAGLTMEMASVAALKNELEDNFEKAKNELSELELQKEKLYHELQSQISNHEIMVQERDNRLSESEMKYKQLEDQVFDVSEKLKSAEQRIEELEEDRLKIEAAKDVIIQNLQVSIEEMTRDIKTSEEEINRLKGEVSKHIEDYKLLQISAEEEKAAASTKMDTLQQLNDDQKEEIAKLQESLQGAEVQLCLLTQKLQITESEFEKKEEFFRRKEEEMLEKHKSLEEQVSLSSKKITTLENEKKEMHGTTTDALKSLNAEFGNLISAIQRLDEYHYQMHLRLSEFSRELQVVKKSLSDIKSHKQVLRGEIQDLTKKLVDTGRSKYILEKKLGHVETTMKETASENNKLMESVANYVKKMGEIEMEVRKREVEMAEKNEEKREAIRQLCIYIEYYRENHDIVKESLLKMLTRTRRSA